MTETHPLGHETLFDCALCYCLLPANDIVKIGTVFMLK